MSTAKQARYVHKGCGGVTIWDLSGGFCTACHAEGLDADEVEPVQAAVAPAPGTVPDDTGQDLPSSDVKAQGRLWPDPEESHQPGPKRMVGRRVVCHCRCGKPWPCDRSWQARAEAAEGKMAAIRSCATDWKLLIGDGDGTDLAGAILAIIGSEGEGPDPLGDLRAELGEAQSEAAMIRDHAQRYLKAAYGPEYVYKAPETFGNLLERWIWAVASGVPEIAHASIADIERHCAELEAEANRSDKEAPGGR